MCEKLYLWTDLNYLKLAGHFLLKRPHIITFQKKKHNFSQKEKQISSKIGI